MRYQLEMNIDAPREKIIAFFDDLEHYKAWQPGFVSYTPVSGGLDEVGRQTRLVYKMGKHDSEMLETVTVRNPPEEYAATYEVGNVWNLVENRFDVVDADTTQWTLVSEFRCKGIMRVMTILMPGMFKNQTRTYMQYFKAFVEGAEDLNN